MNSLPSMKQACLAVLLLTAAGTTIPAHAAAPALNGQITLRPLTPQENKDYALTTLKARAV